MTSAWFGLNTGLRALVASQIALDTAAHNTANANTEGYSRQRVNLVEAPPYTFPAFNRSGVPGQIGTGVAISTIERVRDAYLDLQIRGQLAGQGYWDARRDELAKIESVFPEPGGAGLGTSLSRFWNAWQDLAADPTSTAARTAVVEQAQTMAQQFTRDAGQLTALASGIDAAVAQQVSVITDLAARIASLNEQIQRVVVSGDHANDLADQRDLLLDKLNTIIPVTLSEQTDGTMTVLINGTDLVTGGRARAVTTTVDLNGHLQPAWTTGGTISATTGRLAAVIEVRDVTLAGYRAGLNDLARGIADAVNGIHQAGIDATGAAGLPFFTYTIGNEAGSLAVSAAISGDPRRIATAAAPNRAGDGSVAGLIADLRNAISRLGGAAGTDLVVGEILATGGAATVETISVGRAKAQTYTFTAVGNQLTLTGADLSTQTITVADMLANTSQVLDFAQLGIKLTLTTGAAPKTAADITTDLTAAADDRMIVNSIFPRLGGVTGTDLVVGDILSTGGAATVDPIVVGQAKAQTYTFTAVGNQLTLTGADLSTQTIIVADMLANTSQVLDFAQLGIKITLTTGGAPKTAADITTDLTAAADNTLVVNSAFSIPQITADFYSGLVSSVGSDSRQAIEIATNQGLLVDHLTTRRESISGVSLDEEATDMIRFQHAYQAAARVISIVDEMLDTLINRTGVVGR